MKKLSHYLIPMLLVTLLSACTAPQESHERDEAKMIKAMETLIEVHNTLETDKLDAIMSPNFKRIAPDENTNTREEYKEFLRNFHSVFSDFNMVIDESAVGPEGGFIKWSVKGTYIAKGAAEGGSPIDVTGLGFYEFSDGALISEFIGFNPGWFQEQLENSP